MWYLPEEVLHQKPAGAADVQNDRVNARPDQFHRFDGHLAASKAAVVRLTETLAEELREFSIAVNAIAPGR
ncbi:MAG: SDR family NAD(P)-dependent oxidoreductase [Verrucomicrobia bacterium]|nr:SDR family NAD(P)-dependent oxidoreductase [Verrucomicrobiota bacterium]